MTNGKRTFTGLSLLAFLLMVSCSENGEGLFNPDFGYPRPQPVVNSITPASGYLAGVDLITLSGENFLPIADSNRVYFNGQPGVVLSATETSLDVRSAAGVTGNEVAVKVAVTGAEQFSEPFTYTLNAPIITASEDLKDSDVASANTSDANGNIYTHLIRDGSTIGIQQIDAATGALTEEIPPQNRSVANDLLFKDNKFLAIFSQLGAVFTWDVGSSTNWTPSFIVGTSSSINEIEFDENGYLWAAGSSPSVTRFEFANSSNSKKFNLGYNFTGIRYYNGKLYLLTNMGDAQNPDLQVLTFDIDANGDLVNEEVFFDFDNFPEGDGNITRLFSIEIASDGTVYVGVDAPLDTKQVNDNTEYFTENGIVEIKSDGSSASYLYPGVIPGNIAYMYWTDSEMLNIVPQKVITTETVGGETTEIVVQNQSLLQLNMLEKRRAPHYGD